MEVNNGQHFGEIRRKLLLRHYGVIYNANFFNLGKTSKEVTLSEVDLMIETSNDYIT